MSKETLQEKLDKTIPNQCGDYAVIIPVDFAVMVGTFIIQGKNMGPRLDPAETAGIRMYFTDDSRKIFEVEYKDYRMKFPQMQVQYWHEGVYEERKGRAINVAPPVRPSAQVDSPMSHVHAGLGAGKTK